MRWIVATPMFVLSIGACVATPPPPATTMPAASSATLASPGPMPGVPSSGGTTMDSAEPIAQGATVEGWAAKDQPRFYRLDAMQPGELQVNWYTQIMTSRGEGPGINPTLFVLDPNGGKLTERTEATYSTQGTGNFDQETITVPVSNAGSVILQVDCQNCGAERVHYKIMIQ